MESIEGRVRKTTIKIPPIYGTQTKNIHFQDIPISLILLTVSGRDAQRLPKNNSEVTKEKIDPISVLIVGS